MKIHVKRLFDEYSCKEYVFYKTGEFNNPLFILSEAFAVTLRDELSALIDEKEFIVREARGDDAETEE